MNDPHGQPYEPGSIVITPTEVYAKITSLTASVERLVTQNESWGQDRQEDRQRMRDLESRVSSIERKVWMIAGGAATLGSLIGTWLPNLNLNA